MSQMSRLFAALSDARRLEIVEALMRDGETPAGAISGMFDISGPAVSRHLAVLLKAGVVTRRVAGQHRLYSVRADTIRKLSEWALDHRAFWDSSLDRIEAALLEDRK